MIGILHGYSLEGSGSNLWTRYMAQTLCRLGETFHLVCQEKTPEKYDFISDAYEYDSDGTQQILFTNILCLAATRLLYWLFRINARIQKQKQ